MSINNDNEENSNSVEYLINNNKNGPSISSNQNGENSNSNEIQLLSSDEDSIQNDDPSEQQQSSINNNNNNIQNQNNHERHAAIYPQISEISRSRIGDEYQARPVNLEANLEDRSKVKTRETLVWKPCDKLTEKELNDYLNEACQKHAYNIEQALALLTWDEYSLTKAYNDLKIYVPRPNHWTHEDQILFESAFSFHGKNFSKIRQVLPDKKQSDLVNYYYKWKKTRTNTSSIDIQQLNSKNNNESPEDSLDGGSGGGSGGQENGEFGDDDGMDTIAAKICLNCDLITNDLQSTPKGLLCNPCYNYWKDTGVMKPDHLLLQNSNNHSTTQNNNAYTSTSFGGSKVNNQKLLHKSLRKPPKGIYLNCEELMDLAKTDNNAIFDSLNVKLRAKKEEVQRNKQLITDKLLKLSSETVLEVAIDNELLQLEERTVPTPNWTTHEITLALQGFSRYGEDFKAIAQVLGSKTEGSVRAFYEYNKDILNLDKLISNVNPKDLREKANQLMEETTVNSSKQQSINSLNPKIPRLSTETAFINKDD